LQESGGGGGGLAGVVNTTLGASKASPSHSISFGLDALGFAQIVNWHLVRLELKDARAGAGGVLKMEPAASRSGMQGKGDERAPKVIAKLDAPTPPALGAGGSSAAPEKMGGDRAFSVAVEQERAYGRPHCLSLAAPALSFSMVIQLADQDEQLSWAAGLQRAIDNTGTGTGAAPSRAPSRGEAQDPLLGQPKSSDSEEEEAATAAAAARSLIGSVSALLPMGMGTRPVQAQRSSSTVSISQGKWGRGRGLGARARSAAVRRGILRSKSPTAPPAAAPSVSGLYAGKSGTSPTPPQA